MEIKDRDVLKLDDNKDYQVQGIKEIDGRKVYCIQDLQEGFFKFAIEKNSKIVFVNDRKMELMIAKKFKD